MRRLVKISAFALCVLATITVPGNAAKPPSRNAAKALAAPAAPGSSPGVVASLDQGSDWVLLTVPGSGAPPEEEIPIEVQCPPWGCPTPGPFVPPPTTPPTGAPSGSSAVNIPSEGEPPTPSDLNVYVLHGQLGVLDSPLSQSLKEDLLAEDDSGGVATLDINEGEPLYIVRQDIAEALDAAEVTGVLPPEIIALSERSITSQSSCAMKEHTFTRAVDLSGHDFTKSFNLGDGFTGQFAVSGNLEGAVTAEVHWYEKRKKFLAWCVPYGAKLKDVHIFGDAVANAGATVSGTLTYQHSFGPYLLAKPELFGVLFFVGPIPVYIGFNLPIQGGLDLTAQGTGSITYNGSKVVSGTFDWVCDLDECHGDGGFDNDVASTTQTITGGVSGHLKPEPYVDVGFRAYLYTEGVAYLQAGLRPRLMGDLWGYSGNNCGDALGDGTFESVQALTFDLDWRVDLTAEASALGANPWRHTIKTGSASHIGFYDLLGSSALAPELLGSPNGQVGTSSEYLVKVRPCWPYDKKITYRMNWGDGSAPVEMETDPAAYTRFNHTWTAAGNPTLTATTVKDKHGRALGGSTARPVAVVDCTAPTFSAQPQAATIEIGQSATLSVTSNATSFQWYRGTSGDLANPIAGATASSVSVTPGTTTSYWVRALGSCSTATNSSTATVTVTAFCAVEGAACGGDGHHTCRSGQCACTDCASGVCCGASGSAFCDGQAHTDPGTGYTGSCASTLPGCAAASDFNGSNALFHDGNVMACIKFNGTFQWQARRPSPRCQEVSPLCGFACSTHYGNGAGFQCDTNGNWNPNAPVPGCSSPPPGWSCVTCTAPQIASLSPSSSIQEGQSTTLTVQASGTSLTYQWYRGSAGTTANPVSGGTAASLAVTPSTTTSYWVRVTNSCGQVDSSTVTVTVTPACIPPTFTAQPQSVSIFPGATATLSVSANGTNLQYQWYQGASSAISGGTGPTLFVSPASTQSYWVQVYNACGALNSNSATVTVTCGPDGASCGGDGHHTCQSGQCACTDCGSAACCGASGNTACNGQSHFDPNTGYTGTCTSALPSCGAGNDFDGTNNVFHDGDLLACVKRNGTYGWMARRPSPRCQEVAAVCDYLCANHFNGGSGFQCDQNGSWTTTPPSYCSGGTVPTAYRCP